MRSHLRLVFLHRVHALEIALYDTSARYFGESVGSIGDAAGYSHNLPSLQCSRIRFDQEHFFSHGVSCLGDDMNDIHPTS